MQLSTKKQFVCLFVIFKVNMVACLHIYCAITITMFMFEVNPMWLSVSVMQPCWRNCLHVSMYTHEYDTTCNSHCCHWHSQRLIRALRCNRLGIFIFPLGARQGANRALLPWKLMVRPTHLLMRTCIHTKPLHVAKSSPITD